MATATLPSRRRLAVVGLYSIVFGVTLAGFQAHTMRYAFSSIPVPYTILCAAVIGFTIALLSDGVWESILLVIGTALVGGAGTVVLVAVPVITVPDLPTVEANAMMMNGVAESVLFTALSAAIMTIGAVVGRFLLVEELLDRTAVDSSNGTHALVLALLIASLVLSGTLAINYTSAVEQRDVDATVTELTGDGDEITVTIELENRLQGTLVVDRAFLRITADEGQVETSRHEEQRISAGETGTVTVTTTCEQFENEGLAGDRLSVEGTLYVEAFNDFDTRTTVEPAEFDNPCA